MHIDIVQDFSNLYKKVDFIIDFAGCFTAVEVYPTTARTSYIDIVDYCQTKACIL